MTQLHRSLALAFATLGLAGAAQAHQIWIEQAPGQQAVIRFGEYGDNLREASPGLLDKFGKPTAKLVSAAGVKSADGAKSADGFTLPFQAGAGDSIVAEDALYPLYTWDNVRSRYYPAARLITGFAPQQPQLTLDLVPTGTPGAFQLVFKGQPLPKAKVNLVTQSGWAREAHTDAAGMVQFDMPWQGAYVAEVNHTDRTPGQRQGTAGAEAFQTVSYVTSLTYVKPDGVAPIPAGPAAAPSK